MANSWDLQSRQYLFSKEQEWNGERSLVAKHRQMLRAERAQSSAGIRRRFSFGVARFWDAGRKNTDTATEAA